MQIPNDPILWTVLIVLVAAVLGFAIWRRYSVVLRRGDTEVRLERPSDDGTAGVSVAAKAKIENSQVGNITGMQITGAQGTGTGVQAPSVGVAGGATIKGSKVGDITGVAQRPPPSGARES